MRQADEDAFVAHYLECMPDSGQWPCDIGGASSVRLHQPHSSTGASGTFPQPTPRLAAVGTGSNASLSSPSVLAAEAELRPNEIQELADQIGELTKVATAVGVHLAFHLRMEVSTGGREVPPETLTHLNALLDQVKSGLKVQ